jgi:hypothetical protein
MSAVSPRTHNRASFEAKSGVSPLIAMFLGDEQYFRDGPPAWPKAPLSREAHEARCQYIKRLRRFSSQFPDAQNVAGILASCDRRYRCMSGACPECLRAFQRWFVSQVQKLAGDTASTDLRCVSVVLQNYRTADDKLDEVNTVNVKRSISATINKPNALSWIAGGIDLSLNDDTQKNQGTGWQPQLYAIAHVTDLKALSTVLSDKYKSTKTVRRPIYIKECDGSARAISYAFKTQFVRRVAYRKKVGDHNNRRKCWDTRKISLRPTEHVQALLWMHSVGFSGRLFLQGLRMTRTGKNVGLAKVTKTEAAMYQ